jgi:hypothetical protein
MRVLSAVRCVTDATGNARARARHAPPDRAARHRHRVEPTEIANRRASILFVIAHQRRELSSPSERQRARTFQPASSSWLWTKRAPVVDSITPITSSGANRSTSHASRS